METPVNVQSLAEAYAKSINKPQAGPAIVRDYLEGFRKCQELCAEIIQKHADAGNIENYNNLCEKLELMERGK